MTWIGPDTPWRATRTARYAQLLVGLVLYGFGLALMVRAAVGVAPWDVLSQGVANVTGMPFGLATNLIGVVVLLFWIPIRQRPGIGTVLNVLLIGPSAQLGLFLVPELESLWVRVPVFAVGLLLVGVATGLYIGANHGPGPRDGLMTGIHRRTGWPIWAVRTAIEVTVLGIGWLLGGNVGLGTLAFALLIGPLVNLTMPLLAVRKPPPAPLPVDQVEEVKNP
ncbi:MAG: hypothetical protein M3Y46_06515 [Actinomycetota bacterium]|nr:hypothetical protein [Actinomycetota bacterium]